MRRERLVAVRRGGRPTPAFTDVEPVAVDVGMKHRSELKRVPVGAGALALLAGLSLGISPAQATVFGSNGKIFCTGARPIGAPSAPGVSRNEIFSVNPDGTNETLVTNNDVSDNRPVVSPDGKTVAFESFRSGSSEIWTAPADGTGVATRLTFTNTTPTSGPENRAESWSPDGKKIAFHSSRDGNFEIYTMNADGSNQTRLTDNPASDTFARWSPDGQRIAFTSSRSGDFEIWTMNPDGTGLFRVTNSLGEDAWPSWSPDGQQLTFHSRRTGVLDIYRMNADGTGAATRLTFTPTQFEYFPIWSPDGTRIVYNGTDPVTSATSIYTISAVDGSDTARVTVGTGDTGCDWQTIPLVAQAQPLVTPPAPPVIPTPSFAPDTLAPTATGVRASNGTFAVSGASTDKSGVAARRRRKQGTMLRYTLSEKATVKISIAERRRGKLTVRGTLTRASHQGDNAVFFSGRIGSKALKPGSYKATLTATDAARNVSQAKSISFKIVKG